MARCVLVLALCLSFASFVTPQCNNEACGEEYQPVCASDGITYANQCEFTAAQCADTSLVVEVAGPCTEAQAKGLFDDDDGANNSDDDDSEDLFWLLALLALPLALCYFCSRGQQGCGGGGMCGGGGCGGCGMMPYYGGGCGGGGMCC